MPTALGSLAMVPAGTPSPSWCSPSPWSWGCELVPSALLDQTAATISPSEQSSAAPDQQQKPQVLSMSCGFFFYFEQVPQKKYFPPADDQCCIKQQVRPSSFPTKCSSSPLSAGQSPAEIWSFYFQMVWLHCVAAGTSPLTTVLWEGSVMKTIGWRKTVQMLNPKPMPSFPVQYRWITSISLHIHK